MLNDYAFGGFLIFEHVRPFIDARVELYGDKMLSLYDKLRSGDHEAVETRSSAMTSPGPSSLRAIGS